MSFPWLRAAAPAALALLLASCSEGGVVEPALLPHAPSAALAAAGGVRFSEIHYDNASTDVGERIEVMGPAGTDLTGWKIVLYNGNGGASYATLTLSGTIPATCEPEGVVVVNGPSTGIQNGDPDGFALVDASNTVLEFLSYGGPMTAVGGAAGGKVSADIGVKEGSSTPAGHSLQRKADGSWAPAAANTFGACNPGGVGGGGGGTGGGGTGGGIVPTGSLLSELRIDQTGTDNDEYFELAGAAGTSLGDLTYLVIGDDDAESSGVVESVVSLAGRSIPARGYFVAAEPTFSMGTADLVVPELNFENADNLTHLVVRGFTGAAGADLDADDDGTLDTLPWAEVVDCLSLVRGAAAADNKLYCSVKVGPDGSFVPGHVYREGGAWKIGAFSGGQDSPGGAAGSGGGTPGVVRRIVLSRFDADYWVPAGYQKPLFAEAEDAFGTTVRDVPLAWTSSDPSVATVDGFGYVTGVKPGSVTITATSPNGVSSSQPFVIRPGDEPTSAVYRSHVAFGVPADASPADDFLIEHGQFVVSYNETRGNPNWVAWNLNASHFGSEDRCECFTPDPKIPSGMKRVTDADYRSSGYSRGHMTMSANRTTTGTENAATFLMTNILPQHSRNNGGPWLEFETHLNDLARSKAKEIYILAGGDYSATPRTLRGEGKVQIPEFTWKIAVVLDAGEGLESVKRGDDLEVLAIRTPNDSAGVVGIVNDWTRYVTTVDAIEARTGYDFLASLPDLVERLVERGGTNSAPVAATDGPYTIAEGASVTFSAAGSTDPEGDALTYSWDFGNGQTATGASVTRVFAQDGKYDATLTVTDAYGKSATATTHVIVADLAPKVEPFAGAELLEGETYSAAGSFVDPGADQWTATVDYGTGTAVALPLSGKSFTLTHRYGIAGSYQVTVRVADQASAFGTGTATVVVKTPSAAIDDLAAQVKALLAPGSAASRALSTLLSLSVSGSDADGLLGKLENARKHLEKNQRKQGVDQMEGFNHEVEKLLKKDGITAAQAKLLTDASTRIIASINSR